MTAITAITTTPSGIAHAQPPSGTIAYTLRMRPLTSSDMNAALDRLSEIMVKHAKETDMLSQSLFGWSQRVLTDSVRKPSDPLSIAQKHLNTLTQFILFNPRTSSSYANPVLEREWVWEEEDLKQFRLISRISPFDAKEMSESTRPHLFARAMIAWVKALNCDDAPQKSLVAHAGTELVLNKELSPMQQVAAASVHTQLAGYSLDIQRAIQEEQMFNEFTQALFQLRMESEARIERRARETELKCQAHIKALEDSSAATRKIHDEQISRLNAAVTNAVQQLRASQANLAAATQHIAALQLACNQLCEERQKQAIEMHKVRDRERRRRHDCVIC